MNDKLRGTIRDLLELVIAFAKIGAVTFGGGYAMLPILQRDIVNTRHWATEEELMDYFAVGQCTPGIIAVNTATFIGRKRAGIAGGIAATLGMILPSMIIISLIAALISNFAELAWVKNAFAGIQVCVCVLIFNAVIKLLKKAVTDNITAFLFALVLAGGVVLNLSPVWFVIFSAFVGIGLKTLEASDAFKIFQSRRVDDLKTGSNAKYLNLNQENQDRQSERTEQKKQENQENQTGQAKQDKQESQTGQEKQENQENNQQESAAEDQETGDAV